MLAEDLRLEELVSFTDGLVSLHGRRLILHDIHAMAHLRKDLVETLGADESRRILCRFGYFWGEADAAAMRRIVEWDGPEQWLLAGPRLHKLQGVVEPELTVFELGPDRTLHIEVIWRGSAEADEQLIELGPSPDAGCWILSGYASGYASFCLDRPVYFVERTCRSRGDGECTAVGKDRESWQDEADAIAAHFEVGDIQAKVKGLTEELRERNRELARERARLRDLAPLPDHPEVRSKAFLSVLDIAQRVARFDSSVLITGESGTGKEVVARYIHRHSERGERKFVAVNCGALPDTLLESELFGHAAGSFTGAIRNRPGLFEEAQGGTILLDEIGDVTPALQVKLLRVLQEKEVRRVGENQPRKVDARVIAATNRRLGEEVRAGRFREDLFYRLGVVEIVVPPLRERVPDIIPLARFFAERLQRRLDLERLTLHATSMTYLESYFWPGNVRELENAIERAAVMSDDGWIRPEHLPPALREIPSRADAVPAHGLQTLAEVERDYTLAVLERFDGNRTRAARHLGISTTTLWRRLKAWETVAG